MSTVAIISIGDMGLGVARLLVANGYRVVTNATGRSEYTIKRAQGASVEILATDEDLVQQADYILSVLPPRDALALASRIASALTSLSPQRTSTLYYADLNAIAPTTVTRVGQTFENFSFVKFIDGSILGLPARLRDGIDATSPKEVIRSLESWHRPAIPTSGPHRLPEDLEKVLNVRYLNDRIGSASGLKMCFGGLSKGYAALCLQVYTAAESLGVLQHLKDELDVLSPHMGAHGQRVAVSCPPKAYRWVKEMQEVQETFAAVGFGQPEDQRGGGMFGSFAEMFRFLAEDTPMGKERIGERKTTTIEEVARGFLESLPKDDSGLP